MKPLLSLLAITLLLAAYPVHAAGQCADTINVHVNGMVCDFCARALEKVFGGREEVSGIKVDLDKSLVTVNLKSGKNMDDATLTKLITDSGYAVSGINHGC